MLEIKLTQEQAEVIQEALDLYTRIGLGQFQAINDHRQIRTKFLFPNEKLHQSGVDYKRDASIEYLTRARNTLFDFDGSMASHYSIHNSNVINECRIAYDIFQIIRNLNKPQSSYNVTLSDTTGSTRKVKISSAKEEELSKFNEIKFGVVFTIPEQKGVFIKTKSVEYRNLLTTELIEIEDAEFNVKKVYEYV